MLYAKAFLIWLAFAVVAVALGAWRDKLLRPRLGDFRAHQLETLVVCAVFFAIIVGFVRWVQPSEAQALWIGAFWVVLTLLFEFGLGRALGRPMETLLADYNLLRGRLWPLVLVTELVGPWIATVSDGGAG